MCSPDGSICLALKAPSNLAENQPTWQTSTDYDGDASKAVDGGLSAHYLDRSCTHTDSGPAIWAVDLVGIADIQYIEVLNRVDELHIGEYSFRL